MTALLIALNIIPPGLFLIAVVLLQTGKGADMGAAFGGANPAVFGPAGSGNLLTRATAVCAAVFMGSSLMLAVLSARKSSVFDDTAEPTPVAAPAPSVPAGEAADTGGAAAPPAAAPEGAAAGSVSLEDAIKQAAQQAVEGAGGTGTEPPAAAAEAEPARADPAAPQASPQQPAAGATAPPAGSSTANP